ACRSGPSFKRRVLQSERENFLKLAVHPVERVLRHKRGPAFVHGLQIVLELLAIASLPALAIRSGTAPDRLGELPILVQSREQNKQIFDQRGLLFYVPLRA